MTTRSLPAPRQIAATKGAGNSGLRLVSSILERPPVVSNPSLDPVVDFDPFSGVFVFNDNGTVIVVTLVGDVSGGFDPLNPTGDWSDWFNSTDPTYPTFNWFNPDTHVDLTGFDFTGFHDHPLFHGFGHNVYGGTGDTDHVGVTFR